MIHILVDSAADFSKKEIEEKGIHLVPLQVSFQEEQYLDGVNLERDEFYEKLVHGKAFPKTSQPSPQEFLDVFEEVKEKNPDGVFFYSTTKTNNSHSDMKFVENSFLVFGKETKGLPEDLLKANPETCMRIPMLNHERARSLNLSNAVAIVVFEALRQIGYPNMK